MASADTLGQRYGGASPWRRRAVLAVAVVVASAFLGWLGWATWSHSTPQVTSELETFSIIDDHTASAVLLVTLADAGVEARCTVRAIAEDHTVVGELAFTPDPALGRRQVIEIRTERRATAVESLGCTAPGQGRAR